MSYVTVKNFDAPLNVLMVTEQGNIKKTALSEFSNPRKTGIVAIGLDKGDRLIDVHLTDGKQDVVIGTAEGMAIRFHEQEVRIMGRGCSPACVRSGLQERRPRCRCRGAPAQPAPQSSSRRRTGSASEARPTSTGSATGAGKGIITVKTTEKTGRMMAIKEVMEKDDVVIVTNRGVVIRQHASDIRVAGRNTQGVRLIRLDSGDTVADVAAVPADEDEPGEGGEGNGAKAPANGEDQETDRPVCRDRKGRVQPKNAKASPPAKKGKRRS